DDTGSEKSRYLLSLCGGLDDVPKVAAICRQLIPPLCRVARRHPKTRHGIQGIAPKQIDFQGLHISRRNHRRALLILIRKRRGPTTSDVTSVLGQREGNFPKSIAFRDTSSSTSG